MLNTSSVANEAINSLLRREESGVFCKLELRRCMTI